MKWKAFWAALFAFLLTVALGTFWSRTRSAMDPERYALWVSEDKSRSEVGLTANMTPQVIPVFGSSEFNHGKDTVYHPSQVFAGLDVTPMMVGAGYYQSLSHAVTLCAIEGQMPLRRAVLILSPQWFRKTGVVDQAYTSRFSEILYAGMLANPRISQETKAYFSERTHSLLKGDTATLARVSRDEDYYLNGQTEGLGGAMERLWLSFLREKDTFTIAFRQFFLPNRQREKQSGEPDWEALLRLADAEGAVDSTNPFYILNSTYEALEPHLPEKKGMNADADKGYQTGPEFQDLAAFIKVCKETGIECMLVIVPVNGYYYDFTEFPRSARQAYYQKIRDLAATYGARVCDLSGEEYTPYFFEDRVHLGKKGWTMVDKAIYAFAKEGGEPRNG